MPARSCPAQAMRSSNGIAAGAPPSAAPAARDHAACTKSDCVPAPTTINTATATTNAIIRRSIRASPDLEIASILTDGGLSMRIYPHIVALLFAASNAAIVSASDSVIPPAPQPAKEIRSGYNVVEIAKGLDHPWSMAFLPDGSMLVTERVGRLRLIKGGSLQAEPIGGVPAVHTGSQAGLFDIVLHPNFAQNNIVFL